MSSDGAPVEEAYPWERALGARPFDDGRAEFRVWAVRRWR
jgi:hypothetical protein